MPQDGCSNDYGRRPPSDRKNRLVEQSALPRPCRCAPCAGEGQPCPATLKGSPAADESRATSHVGLLAAATVGASRPYQLLRLHPLHHIWAESLESVDSADGHIPPAGDADDERREGGRQAVARDHLAHVAQRAACVMLVVGVRMGGADVEKRRGMAEIEEAQAKATQAVDDCNSSEDRWCKQRESAAVSSLRTDCACTVRGCAHRPTCQQTCRTRRAAASCRHHPRGCTRSRPAGNACQAPHRAAPCSLAAP